MTDDFILKWDAQNQQLIGEDPDTGDKIPVPIESVSTEELLGGRKVAVDGDIQAKLDEEDRRAAYVYVPGDLGTVEFDETIYYGQASVIEGEQADLVDQAGGRDFSPRPIIEFVEDIDGFTDDPDADYRPHRPTFENITIRGTSDNNDSNAILSGAGNQEGIGTYDQVFVERYETGIRANDEQSVVAEIKRCHFAECRVGVLGFRLSTIKDNNFWNFTNDSGVAVSVGEESIVTENDFEMGGGNGAGDTVGVDVFGNGTVVTENQFTQPYSTGVVIRSEGVLISSNHFDGSCDVCVDGQSGSVLTISDNIVTASIDDAMFKIEHGTSVIGNQAIESSPSSGAVAVEVNGNYNHIAGNRIGSGFSTTVELNGSNNIVIGELADGFVDNGSLNIINGRGFNSGDPNTEGDWNDEEDWAQQTNAVVEDTENDNLYKAIGGSFVQIN